ncbi:hypothetical protein V1511DRAFT_502397 [Dipodascopsis uninucleata]
MNDSTANTEASYRAEKIQESDGTLHHRLLGPSLQKSGQDGVNQTEVSRIIYEASEGTKYFEHQKAKEEAFSKKIQELLGKAAKLHKQDLEAATIICEKKIIELETTRDLTQSLVHVDCDAFYAAVEELENPELKDKPFAVGGGVLCTCNYIARKFGVRSAMAEFVAKKICPQLIVRPLNFAKYAEKSKDIRSILMEYDPNLCATTLDEAYLNITEYCERNGISREDAVREMRFRILSETGLSVSAGIGPNTRIAKIASNINKPNGQFQVTNDRDDIMEFMAKLPVRKVTGIGYVLERELNAIGVEVCGDIHSKLSLIYHLFSESTLSFLLNCYLGLGSTIVRPLNKYKRKSISCETTFRDMTSPEEIKKKLRSIAEDLSKDCQELNFGGKKLSLKLKKNTYELITRTKNLSRPIYTTDDLYKYGLLLLEKELPVTIRLIGLRVSDLVDLTKEGPLSKKMYIKNRNNSENSSQDAIKTEQSTTIVDVKLDEQNAEDLNVMIHSSQEIEIEREQSPNAEQSTAVILPNSKKQEIKQLKYELLSSEHIGLQQQRELTQCPICGNHVRSDDVILNQHIDWCLSRETIREAVSESYREPVTKRQKVSSGKQRSIF